MIHPLIIIRSLFQATLPYTIDGGNLRIIDIANPSFPYQIGYYNTPGYARGIFVSDSFSYVADGNAGLQIY